MGGLRSRCLLGPGPQSTCAKGWTPEGVDTVIKIWPSRLLNLGILASAALVLGACGGSPAAIPEPTAPAQAAAVVTPQPTAPSQAAASARPQSTTVAQDTTATNTRVATQPAATPTPTGATFRVITQDIVIRSTPTTDTISSGPVEAEVTSQGTFTIRAEIRIGNVDGINYTSASAPMPSGAAPYDVTRPPRGPAENP